MAKILIVDDEEGVRKVLRRFLERQGHECLEASNTAEARERLKENTFDLLISDIRMPGESGLVLVREATYDFPDLATIMVTAVDDPVVAAHALKAGVCGYLVKPFLQSQVLISVINALRRRQLERSAKNYRERLEKTVQERTADLEGTVQDLLRAQNELKESEEKLRQYARELEETNTALRVLLKKREEDRKTIEERVLANVKTLVQPYLEKLAGSGLTPMQASCVNLLKTAVRDIVSPFLKELSSGYLSLTPMELHVADLVKQGKRNKEIAELLNLSENTIISHRYKIRTKLGLRNRKTNLSTFLHSLQ